MGVEAAPRCRGLAPSHVDDADRALLGLLRSA
jgi:hypothetical protein